MNPIYPPGQASHRHVVELLAASIDFPLDCAEEALIARHLASCQPCADVERDLQADAAGLRGVASVRPPGTVDRALREAAAGSRSPLQSHVRAGPDLRWLRRGAGLTAVVGLAAVAGLAALALLAESLLR